MRRRELGHLMPTAMPPARPTFGRADTPQPAPLVTSRPPTGLRLVARLLSPPAIVETAVGSVTSGVSSVAASVVGTAHLAVDAARAGAVAGARAAITKATAIWQAGGRGHHRALL